MSAREVKPYRVQEWLRKLPMAPKTRGHVRSLMYRLFEKAMLWELIPLERNPMGLVELKGVSKRLRPPRILTEEEFGALLNQLVHPYRCMVLLAACTGLRVSEVMGLRWSESTSKAWSWKSEKVMLKPSHEAEVRVLPRRIAAGSGRRNHSARMEASLLATKETGSFPAPEQTNPTILARCGRRY